MTTNPTKKWTLDLSISEPSSQHRGPVYIHDSLKNDVASVFHADHATVHMPYADAVALSHKMAAAPRMYEMLEEVELFFAEDEGIAIKIAYVLSQARGETP